MNGDWACTRRRSAWDRTRTEAWIARADCAAPPLARRSLRLRNRDHLDRAIQRRPRGDRRHAVSGPLPTRAGRLCRRAMGDTGARGAAQVLPADEIGAGGAGPPAARVERLRQRHGQPSSPDAGGHMSVDQAYIERVVNQLPRDPQLRAQVGMELRSHVAERVEHGHTVEEALQQLGDPVVLAESYLAAVPLIPASFWRRAAARILDFLLFIVAFAPLAWFLFRTTPFVVVIIVVAGLLAASALYPLL